MKFMNAKMFQLLVVLVLFAGCSVSAGEFVLHNNTRGVIKQAHIEVSREVFDMDDIGPGETRNGRFNVKGDSHYEVSVEFANGKMLSRKLGYVTRGFNYKHTIEVSDADILLSDIQIE